MEESAVTDLDITNKLKISQPLKYLDLAEQDIILKHSKIISSSTGNTIVHQGKISQGMHIILSGEARVILSTLEKKPLKLATLKSGDFFGEIGLIQRIPATATVIANKKTESLFFANKNFDALCVYYPEIQFKMTKAILETICLRLEILHNKIKALLRHNKSSKFQKKIHHSLGAEKTSLKKIGIELKTLKKTSFFHTYSHEELEVLTKKLELLFVPKNHIIIDPKEIELNYYIVLRGSIQLSIEEEKTSAKLGVLPPMTIFNSIDLVSNVPSLITYSTCENSILMKISAKNVENLSKTDREIWHKLFHSISKSFLHTQILADVLLKRLIIEKYHG